MSDLIAQYPNVDRQHLRSLVRQARTEKDGNKPPRAYREIYQLLKDLAAASDADEADLRRRGRVAGRARGLKSNVSRAQGARPQARYISGAHPVRDSIRLSHSAQLAFSRGDTKQSCSSHNALFPMLAP